MQGSDKNEENFFEKFGLEVRTGNVEVGKTYPIYGMITNFIGEATEHIIVELNFNIIAKMLIPDASKVNILKQRAFEPGIFVGTVLENDDKLTVECSTVIFGRKQSFEA
jgi:hypothetical protein